MSRLKTITIALAGAAVGITVWQWLSEERHPAPVRVEVIKERDIAPPSAKGADTDMALTKPLGQPLAALVKPAAANPLGRQLRETNDIKAFVLAALKHPERGGAYYASLALERCRESYGTTKSSADEAILYVVGKESTISPERMGAIDAVADRCVGLSEGEVATLQAEASRLASEGRDPLYVLLAGLHNAEGTPDYDKALEAVYTSGSAALISGMFVPQRLVWMTKTNDNGVIATRFNGQSYLGETDRRILDAGAELGACVEDDYCAIDHQMLVQCRALGNCYATREEYMHQQMLNGDQAAIDKATKIADQIRQATARGDRSIFH